MKTFAYMAIFVNEQLIGLDNNLEYVCPHNRDVIRIHNYVNYIQNIEERFDV